SHPVFGRKNLRANRREILLFSAGCSRSPSFSAFTERSRYGVRRGVRRDSLMSNSNETILLIEDNADDVFALRRAIKKAGIVNPLRVATDGQQAIDFLTAAADAKAGDQSPLPFLVLLDLKLPYRD